VTGSTDQYRLTSYGANDFVTEYGPPGYRATRLGDLQANPGEVVFFLIMAFEGSFAGSDHVHAANWPAAGDNPQAIATQAATQSQIDAHGGPPASPRSRGNYSFLDGHAETTAFENVFAAINNNRFVPRRP
jgi:prepilin-type processing-associated H-X9-DG protein